MLHRPARLLFPLAVLALLSSTLAAPARFQFRVPSLEGGVISHEDFKGKIVVVDVWATWCGPCRLIVPHLVRLHERFRGLGVSVVGLNADAEGETPDPESLEAIRNFVRRHAVSYPIGLMNPPAYAEVARVMGLDVNGGMSIPTTFVLGRDGRVLKRYGGYFPGQEEEIADLISRLLAAEAAPAPGK